MAMTKRQKAIKDAVVPGKAYAIDDALKIVKTGRMLPATTKADRGPN